MTTPSTTQRRPTSSSSFHLITPQSRHKPEPTWKTLKMLRKKKRGTRYPSTTGKTHSTSPPTQRMTTSLLPPTATITPDHDYISDDRNDDHRNHAFDNDFDLDMHEPGD
jgi:DNA topoisomerase IB